MFNLCEIGQDVDLLGFPLYDSINEGVRDAYEKYYLRKSIVGDPLKRNNTGTNTPCFIHSEIVKGDKLDLIIYLKGGGSENMSSLKMFKPAEPVVSIIDYIINTVSEAGQNSCPPHFLGIGIGGTADMAMINAKKAVLRGYETEHPDPYYRDLEFEISARINKTNVGPLGFGGRSTVAEVYIKESPTQIASLPVALNLNCHSFRYRRCTI